VKIPWVRGVYPDLKPAGRVPVACYPGHRPSARSESTIPASVACLTNGNHMLFMYEWTGEPPGFNSDNGGAETDETVVSEKALIDIFVR